MSTTDIIKKLASANGISGAENAAAEAAADMLRPYAEVSIDTLGSVTAILGDRDAARRIMLDAHIDEIGMMVTGIDDKGFLRVAKCGGMDRRILPGAKVTVLHGGEEIPGIVCCPDAKGSKVPDWDGIFIDIGRSEKDAKSQVSPGDRIVLCSPPADLLGGRITGKALDDRCGAAALIRAVEIIHQSAKPLGCCLTVLLSVQEETGGTGACAASFEAQPDVAIAVDVSFAVQPDTSPEITAKLGGGPMIGISPILSREVGQKLQSICKELDIPYQLEVMGGRTGTNADDIASSRGGVRCGLVSIPQRNMHTPAEIVDPRDIENTARLLAQFVMEGGAQL